jgi:hypothetical protein
MIAGQDGLLLAPAHGDGNFAGSGAGLDWNVETLNPDGSTRYLAFAWILLVCEAPDHIVPMV